MRSAMVLIAAALFLPMALPATPAQACACCGTYRVVNVQHWDVLNMRSGPGTGFAIIEMLEPGEGCIILTGERHGNWVRVQARLRTHILNGFGV